MTQRRSSSVAHSRPQSVLEEEMQLALALSASVPVCLDERSPEPTAALDTGSSSAASASACIVSAPVTNDAGVEKEPIEINEHLALLRMRKGITLDAKSAQMIVHAVMYEIRESLRRNIQNGHNMCRKVVNIKKLRREKGESKKEFAWRASRHVVPIYTYGAVEPDDVPGYVVSAAFNTVSARLGTTATRVKKLWLEWVKTRTLYDGQAALRRKRKKNTDLGVLKRKNKPSSKAKKAKI